MQNRSRGGLTLCTDSPADVLYLQHVQDPGQSFHMLSHTVGPTPVVRTHPNECWCLPATPHPQTSLLSPCSRRSISPTARNHASHGCDSRSEYSHDATESGISLVSAYITSIILLCSAKSLAFASSQGTYIWRTDCQCCWFSFGLPVNAGASAVAGSWAVSSLVTKGFARLARGDVSHFGGCAALLLPFLS